MVKKDVTLQLRIFDFAGQREYYLVSGILPVDSFAHALSDSPCDLLRVP